MVWRQAQTELEMRRAQLELERARLHGYSLSTASAAAAAAGAPPPPLSARWCARPGMTMLSEGPSPYTLKRRCPSWGRHFQAVVCASGGRT